MTWSLSLSGHTENDVQEAAVVEAVKAAVATAAENGTVSGSLYTQYSGQITFPLPSPPAVEAEAGAEAAQSESSTDGS